MLRKVCKLVSLQGGKSQVNGAVRVPCRDVRRGGSMVLSVSPWFNGAVRVSLVQWCYPCLLGSMVLSVSPWFNGAIRVPCRDARHGGNGVVSGMKMTSPKASSSAFP